MSCYQIFTSNLLITNKKKTLHDLIELNGLITTVESLGV